MRDALRMSCHTKYSSKRGGSGFKGLALYVCGVLYHPDMASSLLLLPAGPQWLLWSALKQLGCGQRNLVNHASRIRLHWCQFRL